MKTEEQVIQQTEQRPEQLPENKEILFELKMMNDNIAQMLEYQRNIDEQVFRLSKDVITIKTVATFFLIVAVIALFPAILSLIANIIKLFF